MKIVTQVPVMRYRISHDYRDVPTLSGCIIPGLSVSGKFLVDQTPDDVMVNPLR